MAQIFTVTANDTLTLSGHVFVDLADGDETILTFPNNLVTRKTGKNGNTLFAQNAPGQNCDLTLRLMRGSPDDVYMQGLINTVPTDFPSTVLLAGTFVKRLGDGQGYVVSDTYTLAGGIISKIPEGKENVDGDTSQAVAVYNVIFASGARSLQ